MTQKEMRWKRKEILNKRISKIYETVEIDGTICFLVDNNIVCRIDSMGGEYNALVIEYANNIDMAKKGIFGEDGNLFYMDEMSEDEMFNAMVSEMKR